MSSARRFRPSVLFAITMVCLCALTTASAATVQGRHGVVVQGGGGHGGHGHWHGGHGGYYGYPYAYYGYPYAYGFGFGYGYPAYGYWGGYYGYPYYPYPAAPPDYAVVDTDISPEEAVVFLDGERIGEADDFDGFPDYLILEPGKHVIEFKHNGYRTLRVELNARRGGYYDIDREMSRGSTKEAPEKQSWGAPPRQRHEMQVPPPPPEDEDQAQPDDENEPEGDVEPDEDGTDEPEEPKELF